uniref:Uncharacterized protein n=1 Tax=Solanum lycopersicum TaxID=4081 RepID=A0A3Q7IUK0_SOLLC
MSSTRTENLVWNRRSLAEFFADNKNIVGFDNIHRGLVENINESNQMSEVTIREVLELLSVFLQLEFVNIGNLEALFKHDLKATKYFNIIVGEGGGICLWNKRIFCTARALIWSKMSTGFPIEITSSMNRMFLTFTYMKKEKTKTGDMVLKSRLSFKRTEKRTGWMFSRSNIVAMSQHKRIDHIERHDNGRGMPHDDIPNMFVQGECKKNA